jgi:Flp pilus assembly protein TadB
VTEPFSAARAVVGHPPSPCGPTAVGALCRSKGDEKMTKLGKKLVAAANEGIAIVRGKADPASYRLHMGRKIDVRAMCRGLGMTQETFALRYGLTVVALSLVVVVLVALAVVVALIVLALVTLTLFVSVLLVLVHAARRSRSLTREMRT